MTKIIQNIQYLNPLEGKKHSLLGWIYSGLGIILIVVCLIALLSGQIGQSAFRHNPGENSGMSAPRDSANETSPFKPANSK